MTLRDLWLRIRALAARRTVDRELDEELAFHLEMETRKLIASGQTPADARALARARFGPASAADACRDARGIAFIDSALRDLHYAIRTSLRTPAVTITIVATIALGLGLSTAVFTIFNALVFRPDAIRDPDSLYSFTWSTRGQPRHRFTLREYDAFRRENAAFADVAARNFDLTTRIEGHAAEGQLVSGNYFQVLGVSAMSGRTLQPDDAVATGGEAVVVLSYRAWQRIFASDPSIVGRTVRVNGFPCDVVGVMPEAFRGLEALLLVDFWAPLTLAGQVDPRQTARSPDNPGGLEVLGRLKPGLSESQARAALAVWASRYSMDSEANAPIDIQLQPRGTSAPLSLNVLLGFSPLFVAFGLILLIGCANVSNLLLARAFARQREMAIRLSLGASRGRLIRQLLTESLVLALTAGSVALLISRAAVDAAVYFLTTTMPPEIAEFLRLDSVVLPTDVRVVMFAVGAAAVSASLFGLMPALQATRAQLVHAVPENLRSNQRSFSLMRRANGGRASRLRSALIVVQVTASALFLICAVIFLRGAGRAAAVDPGVRVSDTLIVDNPANEASRPAIIELLASQPSVSATATAWPAPLLNVPREALAATFTDATSATGTGGLDAAPTSYRFVSSGYFDVLGIDVLSGRTFSNEEGVAHAPVAVLSESAARQFWPAGNGIGQQLRVLRDTQIRRGDEPIMPPPVVTVIGIARDVRGYSPSGNGSDNTAIYLPSANTDPKTAMVVRVHGDPDVTRRTLTERLAAVDPNVGMIITMRSLGALRTYPMQLGFWVIVALGMLALAFTLSGIYGVLSYLVEQRTKEIGVRIALGATAGNVTSLVLWQSLRLVGFGLAAGVFLAWGVSTILTSKLPVTGPFAGVIQLLDGVAYGASLLVICLACVCAAAIPALRAARIDPIAALRHE